MARSGRCCKIGVSYNTGMHVHAIHTPVVEPGEDLFSFLRENLQAVPERSVVAITSKIVSVAQGRVVAQESAEKHDLVRQAAEKYTEPTSSKYDLMLTITEGQLAVNAGIDESNANGMYILWPENPQQVANDIWQFLRQEYHVQEVGVILTDSRTQPLYWGVIGATLAHCGFRALNPLIGQEDIFGREMRMTQESVYQALAVAAVFEMGEAAQQTPLALIKDIRDITFQEHPPTQEELENLHIELEDDVYAPILMHAPWISR